MAAGRPNRPGANNVSRAVGPLARDDIRGEKRFYGVAETSAPSVTSVRPMRPAIGDSTEA